MLPEQVVPRNKISRKDGFSRSKNHRSKSITYWFVFDSLHKGSTINAQLTSFLKQRFLLDHVKFNETN